VVGQASIFGGGVGGWDDVGGLGWLRVDWGVVWHPECFGNFLK